MNCGHKPAKGLYIGLMLLVLLVIISSAIILWAVSYGPWSAYRRFFMGLLFIYVTTLLSLLAFGTLGLIFTLWKGRAIPFFQAPIMLVYSLILPVATILVTLFGIEPDKLKRFLIEINNCIVAMARGTYDSSDIMLVAPHCLQASACSKKITRNVNNCSRCGQCQVGELMTLAERLQVNFVVATGGTIARKFIKDHQPRIVVAVACERDLSSGIQETYPLPVYGVLNTRPNGPCVDTLVDLQEVEQTVTGLMRFPLENLTSG